MAPTPNWQKELIDRAVKLVEKSEPSHQGLMKKVNDRKKTYDAVVEANAEAAQYDSWVYPPYAMHIVETALASMVEDRLRFKVKSRPQLDNMYDPAKAELAKHGAEAHQILLDWQNKKSKFTRLQRPFLLQNAIAGITVAKTYWTERVERRRTVVSVDEVVTDESGEPMLDFYGQPISMPQLKVEDKSYSVYEGPWTEVVDVHDFVWAKNARDLTSSRFVAHLIHITPEELQNGFKEGGPYGPKQGGWSWSKVKKTIGESRSYTPKDGMRWGEKNTDLDEEKVEIIEFWDNDKKDVITVVNRTALIAYKERFPFFHEKPPFVVCTTQSDLFKIPGISMIQKIAALQEMLHNLVNQRIDNVRLLNNAIVIFDPHMVEDADALEFFPGAMWPIGDPRNVQMWQPNPLPAEISVGAEALLKGDMQNISGSFPFSSSTESQTVDQKTATGASIVSSLAQRSIEMAKQPVYDAWEDVGEQQVILNQQFIREPVAVAVIGINGEVEEKAIYPELLAGDFEYEIEPVPSAIMEQQELAKAQALVQVMGQIAPILLPLSQAGAAKMINFDEVITYYLKAVGIENPQQFFIEPAPQQAQLPGAGQTGGPQQAPQGITAPQSIAPEVSPGAQISSSPIANLQRALAMQGGANNV